jgi:AcrR family transcriptional regulator
MLRPTQRLWRLTFESLLCGANPELPQPSRLTAACSHAAEQFTTQCSSSAPLPVALAASTVASLLSQNRLRDAAGVLAVHPHQPEVLRAVRDYVCRYPGVFSFLTLREMSEEAKCVSEAAVTTFLQTAVHNFLSEAPPDARVVEDGDEAVQKWNAQREELRALAVRHIRFHPSSAAALLRPLCGLSEGTAVEREDVMNTMRVAMQQQMLNPADFGCVLEVLQRCRDPRSVASMWGWIQHTSACWDCRAASAAITAFAQLGRIDEAVACIQCLAEAGADPSIEAQATLIRSLGDVSPPLSQYATQLVRQWYPSKEKLWRGAGQSVGIELLKLRSGSGLHAQTMELLEEVYGANADAPAELHRFLQHPHVAVVARNNAARITERPALQRLFLDTVLRNPDLAADRPDLVGLLLSLGVAAHRLPEVYAVVGKLTLNADTFLRALNFFARGGAAKATQAGETLACMEEVASRTGNVVPPELKAWLQLAKEM